MSAIDIVISIYNQERLVKMVLFGLFQNTTTKFNLILVFDGCTDRSKKNALEYISLYKPSLMDKLIIRDTPNVFETRANNVGFRLADEKYLITLQDDMVIEELGWERRLTFPLRKYKNVFAVTARQAHDIAKIGQGKEIYRNQKAFSLGNLSSDVFAIRDIINRGPVAFKTACLRKLGYLDEDFVPCSLDEADLCLRAWVKYRWVCGVFGIKYKSRLEWGKTRSKDSGMAVDSASAKNAELIFDRHQDYLNLGVSHSEEKKILSSEIDYIEYPRLERLWKIIYRPVEVDFWEIRSNLMTAVSRRVYTVIHKIIILLKRSIVYFLPKGYRQKVDEYGLAKLIFMNTPFGVFDSEYCSDLANSFWRDRVSWTKRQIKAIPKGSRVLDLGAGTMPYRDEFPDCDYTSLDFCQNPGINYGKIDVVSDVAKTPFGSGSFDVIVCTEVFEHIPDPPKALKEIARLLKPNGKLIFTAPLGSGQHQAPFHFYGGFTRYWYEKFFPTVGLRITELTPVGGIYGHVMDVLWRGQGIIENYGKIKIVGPILAFLIQLFVFNIPTVVLYKFEKEKFDEVFTLNFLCLAVKKWSQ